jgi:ZIP family zinc transporter
MVNARYNARMAMVPLALLVAAVAVATLAGGAVPLRFERHARLFLSFSAGTLVGLALLELIPEGREGLGGELHPKFLFVLGAFVATMLFDKLHILHPHPHGMDAECPEAEHEHGPLAMHGAIGLLIHSAIDGLALAAALRQSIEMAVAVAVALSAHKFADGLTTVSLVLSHHHRKRQAAVLLLGNVAALLIGCVLGLVLTLQEGTLGHMLLIMAGFFLYLGASDLIPSVTMPRCRKRDVLATALGMATIAVVSVLAH